jgi:hypothetical protein
VYVAGPISKGDLRENIRIACDAGMRLLKAGFAPLVPHATCYLDGTGEPHILPSGTTHEDWMAADLPWVSVTQCLLRLPGESVGADQEVEKARSLGIPVYFDIDTLIQRERAA